jgi:tetratricopeptide (TPR) repeat protein
VFILLTLLLSLQHPETMSLLDKPLYAPALSGAERSEREAALAAARTAYDGDRANTDAALALARAQMALGRVGDALETLTHALEAKPDDPRLALERGRGLLIIRKFELAAREARKGVETLPDASCLLGTALYLQADYAQARGPLGRCPDPGVFAYLAAARGHGPAVPRPDVSREPSRDPSPDIRMPGSPANKPGPATRLPMAAIYLDAADLLLKGDTAGAEPLLKRIVEKDQDRWMEPVYIAAEADYAKLLKAKGRKRKGKD